LIRQEAEPLSEGPIAQSGRVADLLKEENCHAIPTPAATRSQEEREKTDRKGLCITDMQSPQTDVLGYFFMKKGQSFVVTKVVMLARTRVT
jgi:hypothetical protein